MIKVKVPNYFNCFLQQKILQISKFPSMVSNRFSLKPSNSKFLCALKKEKNTLPTVLSTEFDRTKQGPG